MSEEEKVEFVPPKVPMEMATLRATLKVLHQATGQIYDVEGLKTSKLRRFLHSEIEAFVDNTNPNRFDLVGGFDVFTTALQKSNTTCFGACIDLRSGECPACPDQSKCLAAFFQNSKDGFVSLGKKIGITTEVKVEEPVKEKKPTKKVKLNPGDMIAIYDVKNPCELGSARHTWATRVLSWGAMSVADLENVSKNFFPETSIEGLVAELERLGIGCLAKNLPEKTVAKLSKSEKRELGLL